MAGKLTEARTIRLPFVRALAALRDISLHDGFMQEPTSTVEAAMLWRELRRRKWVRGSAITPAGRAALEREKRG